MTTLDRGSRAAARGWSDSPIRNLFIIPTIVFLIIFNIFPLIYSLGYLVHRFRAPTGTRRANFVGLQNYRELLTDPLHLDELLDHGQICDRLGRRADARRLRPGAAAQPRDSRSRA